MSSVLINALGKQIRAIPGKDVPVLSRRGEMSVGVEMVVGHLDVTRLVGEKTRSVIGLSHQQGVAMILRLADHLGLACELTPLNKAALDEENKRTGEGYPPGPETHYGQLRGLD